MADVRVFWDCDHCRGTGMLTLPSTTPAGEVIRKIGAAHRETTGEFEPQCRRSVQRLQIAIGFVTRKARS